MLNGEERVKINRLLEIVINIHHITVYRSLHLTLIITVYDRIYYVKMSELEFN